MGNGFGTRVIATDLAGGPGGENVDGVCSAGDSGGSESSRRRVKRCKLSKFDDEYRLFLISLAKRRIP